MELDGDGSADRAQAERATENEGIARYRTYTIEFKRQPAEERLSGGVGLSELARRHGISRELLRI